ncbi:MAG: XRE family transcriptional regulator [Bacteroidia bacterium]
MNEAPADDRIKKVAEKLKTLRKAAGHKSYETFAWDNDIPRMQYWRMENGKNFQFSSLLRILEVYKMSLEDFFKDL